jgi:hypothetical protein
VERLAYAGHAPVLSEAQMGELSAGLSGRVSLTAAAVCGLVAQHFGLSCTPHAMAQAEADPATPLLFVDATHPAYHAHPAQGWLRRGTTATLKSNHGRVNVTLNGARCWPAREVITRAAVLREWLARPGCRGRVVSLPPDAPNLNRIARRWWVFKQKPLCNTHSPSFADFRSAIRGLFHHLASGKGNAPPS